MPFITLCYNLGTMFATIALVNVILALFIMFVNFVDWFKENDFISA